MEFRRYRLLVWLIVLGVVPLLLLTGFTAYDYFLAPEPVSNLEEGYKLAGQQDLHIAEALAERADRQVESALSTTEKMSTPKMASMDPDDLESSLSAQPKNNPGLLSIYAAKAEDGKTIYSSNESDASHDWKDDPAFKAAKNGDSYVSSVLPVGAGFAVVAAVPIVQLKPTFVGGALTMQKNKVGVLLGVWDWTPVVEAAKKISFGKKGGAALVNETGLVLAGEASQILKTSYGSDKGLTAVLTRIAKNAGAGMDRATFQGDASLVASAPCRHVGWWGVVHLPESELAQPPPPKSYYPLAASGAMLVIALALSFFLWHRITAPMAELATAMAHVKEGNLAIQIRQGGSSEYAAMLEGFQSVVGKLRALNENNETLVSAKQELSKKVDDLSGQVKDLGQRLEEGVAAANRTMTERINELSALKDLESTLARSLALSDAIQTVLSQVGKALEYDMCFA